MLIATTMIIVGFAVLMWSADMFVDGAASLARSIGLSPIIIGLTIVSLGTSAPEVLVSLTAAFAGAGSLAIGNAIGSNIANVGLVLGITLLIAPLMVRPSSMRNEIPTLLLVTVAVIPLMLDGVLSAGDGVLMVIALCVILIRLIMSHTRATDPMSEELQTEPLPGLRPGRAWLTFFVGLIFLIGSSRILVMGAVSVANTLGVPEFVIGLTVIAVGTSLPELAASVTGALRGHTEIALGNVVGSNMFNLLAVMAIPGMVSPQQLGPEVMSRDYLVMAALTGFMGIAIYISRWRSKSAPHHSYLGRTVGVLLLSIYALYYYWLYNSL